MTTVDLSHSKTDHTQRLVGSLAKLGWRAVVIPAHGKLKSNHQLIEFHAPTANLKIRFCLFAVGDRGESHRRDERRIQITTTYQSGLKRHADYKDIVLGYDSQNDVYVGLDARRLEFGGKKHNASSSIDATALEANSGNTVLVRPHDTQTLGLEYQAIVKPKRLCEYIFNVDSIHQGLYVGNGAFSDFTSPPTVATNAMTVPPENAQGDVLILETPSLPRSKKKISKKRVTAYEDGNWDSLADLSPEELEAIRRKCSEIGDRGEYFVFQYEKQRLRKAGKGALAKKVDWISRRAVGRGYDIQSFEDDGTPRLIEVKSTNGAGLSFLMSDKEWKVATVKKRAYYIYRVIYADKTPTLKRVVQDPVSAENDRTLSKIAAGWKIMLK